LWSINVSVALGNGRDSALIGTGPSFGNNFDNTSATSPNFRFTTNGATTFVPLSVAPRYQYRFSLRTENSEDICDDPEVLEEVCNLSDDHHCFMLNFTKYFGDERPRFALDIEPTVLASGDIDAWNFGLVAQHLDARTDSFAEVNAFDRLSGVAIGVSETEASAPGNSQRGFLYSNGGTLIGVRDGVSASLLDETPFYPTTEVPNIVATGVPAGQSLVLADTLAVALVEPVKVTAIRLSRDDIAVHCGTGPLNSHSH
jgi:hypothetical protein